jgi:hypothetical protein
VYAGYAGWSPGQLDSEIMRGGWRVSPFTPGVVFSETPESLWRDLKPPTTPGGGLIVRGSAMNTRLTARDSAERYDRGVGQSPLLRRLTPG